MTPCCAVYSNLKTFRKHFEVNITMLKCCCYNFMKLLKFLREVSKYIVVGFFCLKIRFEFYFGNALIFGDFSCLHITNDVCNVARLHFSSFAFSSDLFRTTNKQILLFSRHISKIHFPLKNCVLFCKWTKEQLLC
jgi:hypothetical protein